MTTLVSTPDVQLSLLLKNCFQFSRLFDYKSKFSFHLETESYEIRTAEKLKELYLIFKLRQEAFLLDDQTCKIPFLIDIDEHDFTCDHIVIVEKKTNKICGTYRMQTSLVTDSFYSQNEFHMDQFLNLPGIKLELGRACIHPKYRNGTVIDLLWRGIARYIQLSNTRYLFGCSSVKITDPEKVSEFNSYLKVNKFSVSDFNIKPTRKFTMRGLKQNVPFSNEMKKLLPPLLRSYLQAGAFVHGDPAYDVDFNCIDMLTILDMRNIQGSYAKRYFPYLEF